MLIACWVSKTRDTHSEYVIFLALSLQQWLHKSVSILRHMYSPYLVVLNTYVHDDNDTM